VTIDQLIGGARGVKCILWETSNLDPAEGIRFRGFTIPECQAVLPTYSGKAGDGEPLLESLLWLLLTSEVPNKHQVDSLTHDLFERSELPLHVRPLLDSLPKSMHPMTQLTIGMAACQTESHFAKAYQKGVPKAEYHLHTIATSTLMESSPRICHWIIRPIFVACWAMIHHRLMN
jgi:citrate synthase